MAAGDVAVLKTEMQDLRISLAKKIPPGTRACAKLPVTCNLWNIYPRKNIPVFRYDVRIYEEFAPRKQGGEAARKEVTKQSRSDYLSIDRKNKCVEIYMKVLEREKTFFRPKTNYVYDRASILYALEQLNIGKDETKTFDLAPCEIREEMRIADCVRICFNIKRCTEDFELATHDLKLGIGSQINRSIQQFYELLLSQEAFFVEGVFVSYGTGDSYLLCPQDFGFNDEPELPEGKYIGVGVSKGVKIVEGPGSSKKLTMGMVVDVNKAAFHIDHQALHEKVAWIVNHKDQLEKMLLTVGHRETVQKIIKGLYVKCSHTGRVFAIAGVTKDDAMQLRFKVNDVMVSVNDYFRQKYNVRLKCPKLPLVWERTVKGDNYYPMEVLVVCENQRVNLTQQSTKQVQIMIKSCAILPAVRLRQTRNMIKALGLDNQGSRNEWLKEMDMTVSNTNVQVEGRVLPLPTIEYRSQQGKALASVQPNTQWSVTPNVQYIIPAVCQKWVVFALVSSNDRFNTGNLNDYVREFLRRCRSRGMKISDPAISESFQKATLKDVELAFKKAEKAGAKFIHFVTSESLKYHARMKLLENQSQILTQDLTTKTALSVMHRSLTMDNIVHKTNLKLGGLNCVVRLEPKFDKWINSNELLFVGVDLAYSPVPKGDKKPRLPTVVGYSANISKHPLDFTGGYRYAFSVMEELDEADTTIFEIMKECLVTAKTNRCVPRHVFILRDGISEGQFKYVVEQELKQVKDACTSLGGKGYRPHLTVLVATKKHNLRLYRKDIPLGARAPDQNIPPGTIVDTDIVNPAVTEFYLNSHSSFQGTAKTPKYNVVFNTSSITSDDLQAAVHGLTFNFQIVSQACALPAPIMIANRMAERGRNNFHSRFGDSVNDSASAFNIDQLNVELGYMGKPLGHQRFNA